MRSRSLHGTPHEKGPDLLYYPFYARLELVYACERSCTDGMIF